MRPHDPLSEKEAEFVIDCLNKKIRIDERQWKQCRDIQISFCKETGVVIAHLGDTKMQCYITAEIATPRKSNRPGDGSLFFDMALDEMAHPACDETKFDFEVEDALTMLETLYRDTDCVEMETLCIEMNNFVFDLRVNLRVLEYSGGLFDCASIAVTTALLGFRRSDAAYKWLEKKITVYSPMERPLIPMTVYHKPITVTFGFMQGIDDPIVDPSDREYLRIRGFLVIGANKRDQICLMYQSGNVSLTEEKISQCSAIAIARAKEITGSIDVAVYGKEQDQ
ncbi:exosome complex component RRP45-like protein [Aphelenchoides avenae]|nr:exosome complex component RRP45-like protein [Aphelenchus avenae]